MLVYTLIKGRASLPTLDELVAEMWRKGINFSFIRDTVCLKTCTLVVLAWDKWLDDDRWHELGKKTKENICIDIPRDLRDYQAPITFEMDDDALLVDKRAFYRGVFYLSTLGDGRISHDKINWLSNNEFHEIHQEYLLLGFDEAVKLSLYG